jgi:hypothetical protein
MAPQSQPNIPAGQVVDTGYQWRVRAIREVLDNVPMWAAMWPSMSGDDRSDVRAIWYTVHIHVDALALRYRPGNGRGEPDWWIMLQLEFEEAAACLDMMRLAVPNGIIEYRK